MKYNNIIINKVLNRLCKNSSIKHATLVKRAQSSLAALPVNALNGYNTSDTVGLTSKIDNKPLNINNMTNMLQSSHQRPIFQPVPQVNQQYIKPFIPQPTNPANTVPQSIVKQFEVVDLKRLYKEASGFKETMLKNGKKIIHRLYLDYKPSRPTLDTMVREIIREYPEMSYYDAVKFIHAVRKYKPVKAVAETVTKTVNDGKQSVKKVTNTLVQEDLFPKEVLDALAKSPVPQKPDFPVRLPGMSKADYLKLLKKLKI